MSVQLFLQGKWELSAFKPVWLCLATSFSIETFKDTEFTPLPEYSGDSMTALVVRRPSTRALSEVGTASLSRLRFFFFFVHVGAWATAPQVERQTLLTCPEKTGLHRAHAEAEGIEVTSTETTLNVAVEAAAGTGEEHSELSTVNEESGHIVGEEHHARCAHSDEEAGSIVLHVSSDMSEEKKMVKKQVRQQQQKRLRRYQRKTLKSEDSSRREETHPKKRNSA